MTSTFWRSASWGRVGPEPYGKLLEAYLGRASPSHPFIVKHAAGAILRDFVWVSSIPLVHQRVLGLLREHGFSGWDTYEVEVFGVNDESIPGYSGLSIIGRCDVITIDKEHSQLIYIENEHGRFPHYKGLFFDRDFWDGSAISSGKEPFTSWVLVREKVMRAFRRAKVTNCAFEPIAEIQLLASKSAAPYYPKSRQH